MKPQVALFAAGILAMINGCSTERPPSPLAAKITRFAPTQVNADISRLSTGDRKALIKLVEAAKLIDRIYARQVWSGNEALRKELEADRTEAGAERLHFYNLNMSPWSNLDHDEPFISGAPRVRPPGANYYPEDMTKEEFNEWAGTLTEEQKKEATGFFTTIRRNGIRHLVTVPYSEEYRDLLIPAARLLKDAAASTDNASLRTFLTKRADAFTSNDYYESDVAWMDLDSPIEPTIGPVRGVPRRAVQLQGRIRGVHLPPGRFFDDEAGAVFRAPAGNRERPPDRPPVQEPEAGGALPHTRRGRGRDGR